MGEVGLELHPDKTRIVYCKDANRRGSHEHESFTFLGFTFRARGARRRDGRMFLSFSPAVSKDALNKMSATVRAWALHRRTGSTEHELARLINPVVRVVQQEILFGCPGSVRFVAVCGSGRRGGGSG